MEKENKMTLDNIETEEYGNLLRGQTMLPANENKENNVLQMAR